MAKPLTVAAVDKHRSKKGERREIPDGGCPGLYLVIQSSGFKSWAFRFRTPAGRGVKLTLGVVDFSGVEGKGEPTLGTPLTLVGARALVSDLQRQRARGTDIAALKRNEWQERIKRGKDTFPQNVVAFVEVVKEKNRSWQDQARYLGLYADLTPIPRGLCDRWRDKPIADIKATDIRALVKEAQRDGVPGLKRHSKRPTNGLARGMHAALASFFSWLVKEGMLEVNPCALVARPEPAGARDRVLNDGEIVKFWKATERERIAPLLKLLLLTGCRLNEVALMRRSELSDDLTTWSLEGDRTKNKKPFVVYLPPLARSLIASVLSDRDLVFTSVRGKPVSGWSRIKQSLDDAMGVSDWVLHDVRRTVATGLAKLEVEPHVIEACLNHVSGGSKVAGIYNRYSYATEKKRTLELWADHIDALVTGRKSNVVAMKRGVVK